MAIDNIIPFERQRRPVYRRSSAPSVEFPDNRRDAIGWRMFSLIAAAMSLAVFLTVFLSAPPTAFSAKSGAESHRTHFGSCFGPVRYSCVVDGDTFWFKGQKIRIADVNTPEISDPNCGYEKQLGLRAKRRLIALLNKGGFSLQDTDRDRDQYGRLLRVVTRGGVSLGEALVNEGLAERWQGHRRNWCRS